MTELREVDPDWAVTRPAVLRDALGVGIATGAYGLSFGAISTASGLSVLQTCFLSLVLFSGGSQFALAGVVGGGGAPMTGAATALLLGVRNGFYGLRLSGLLRLRSWQRPLAAQIVIDESTAMSVVRTSRPAARLAFWSTGISVFVLWNLATVIGAFAADALRDPRVLGLDAAAPAAFLALMSPRLRSREPRIVAAVAAVVALASVPLVPTGVPVLLAAAVAVVFGFGSTRREPDDEPLAPEEVNA
ncbi:MAG TPA: AzlC family ABC transporter permease [Acidothermaceae bacterium]|nr:AzlC family ABC transporter permease [Acidothermaceae bacterium]